MSEVAGRMSVQVGANCLQKANGGFGVLLGGVPGVAPAKVGGAGAAVSPEPTPWEMAVGLRADVTVVDRSVKRLRELSSTFGSQLKTVYSTAHAIEELVRDADLVIGAVLIAGAAGAETRDSGDGQDHESRRCAGRYRHRPRRLLRDQPAHHSRRADLYARWRNSLCRHQYAGAVPRTSTFALTNATLPYVKALADLGWRAALAKDVGLAQGLNVLAGQLTPRSRGKCSGHGLSRLSRGLGFRRRIPGRGSLPPLNKWICDDK